jgi:hypothetical protein
MRKTILQAFTQYPIKQRKASFHALLTFGEIIKYPIFYK